MFVPSPSVSWQRLQHPPHNPALGWMDGRTAQLQRAALRLHFVAVYFTPLKILNKKKGVYSFCEVNVQLGITHISAIFFQILSLPETGDRSCGLQVIIVIE